MSPGDRMEMMDEIRAGMALGEVDREEAEMLNSMGGGGGFEKLVAALQVEMLRGKMEAMPAGLIARLERCAECEAAPPNVVEMAAWRKLVGNPWLGWAAAVVIFGLAWVRSGGVRDEPEMTVQEFRQSAKDLIEREFSGLGAYAPVTGKVMWSDSEQEGFMILSGMPSNDPGKGQYQLWSVDPKRDEAPVDGGVFDIPAEGGSVVVPIHAKLALSDPQAFVITLEQPGGVVKSKQETVVALAKN